MIRKSLFALTAGAALALPAVAQDQGPPRVPGQTGYQRQQLAQAWATAKLAKSPRRHEWVAIKMGDRTLRAEVRYPAGVKGKVPVVIVGHEVFGLTDSTRNTADEIAAMGYITIAYDMLSGMAPNGGGTADVQPPLEAGQLMTHFPTQYANAVFDAWTDYATRLPGSNGKVAIVGLSWSGGAAFRYAAMNPRPAIKVINVFFDVGPPAIAQGFEKYQKDPAPVSVSGITVPIYHFIPTKDTRVVNSAPATKAAMDAAGKKYEQIFLDGAEHAFLRVGEDPKNTNPANAAAIQQSMARLKTILAAM